MPPEENEIPEILLPEEAATVDEAAATFASQIGEDASQVKGRRDIESVLDMMGRGVVVRLIIERPRFVARLTPGDLGLSTEGEGGEILKNYFQMGRRSLIPKSLQDALNRAEANARYALESASIKSHWGHFVPVTKYAAWKAANEKAKERFLESRDQVVREYEGLIVQVEVAYRKAAADVWNRQLWQRISDKLQLEPGQRPTQEATRRALSELRVTVRERDSFIDSYVQQVTAAMPSADNLAERFVYRTEIGYIPLPSTLARDLTTADAFYHHRAELNAAHQTKMAQQRALQETAEAEIRTAQETADAQIWAARQLEVAKTAVELERLHLQKEMEADVLKSAQEQKQVLIDDFYNGIISQINQTLFEICANARDSIERNKGKLTGSISKQLRGLVEELGELNLMADATIEEQIARLRSILPAPTEDSSGKPARIDTARMTRVLAGLQAEAEAVLIDLGAAPVLQRARQIEPDTTEDDTNPIPGKQRREW